MTSVLLQEFQKPGAKGWTPGTMGIKPSDLPSKPEDTILKTSVIFERRLSRQYASKIKFCATCYYKCCELQGNVLDEIAENVISTVRELCVSTVVKQLQDGKAA